MRHVLLTRPAAQARGFAQAVTDRFGAGVAVVISPLIEVEFLKPDLDFSQADMLVFTSQNGVEGFVALEAGLTPPAICVGDKTADAAREAGLEAISAHGDVDALADLLREKAQGKRLLHPCGRHVAGDLGEQLPEIPLQKAVVYDQKERLLSEEAVTLLDSDQPILVPLFSPRTAELFQSQIAGKQTAPLHALCLSAAIETRLDATHFESIAHCDAPTASSMLDNMTLFLTGASS